VSSILEALRELESHRPPTGQGITIPAEDPGPVNRTAEMIGIVSIGLVLGALSFVAFLAVSGAFRAFASRDVPAPTPAPTSAVTPPAPSADAGARPAWLQTADPPRARLGRTAPEPARAVAERPVRVARAEGSASSPIEVTDIEWSPDVARRTVTLMAPSKTYNMPGLGTSFAVIPDSAA